MDLTWLVSLVASLIVPIPASLLRNAGRFLNVFGLSPIVPEHYLLADATFVLDVSRAQRVLGWQPRFSNVEMTVEAYDWYCRHWQHYPPDRSLVLRLLNALS